MRWITAHRAVDGKQSWSAAANGFNNRCPRLSHLQPSPAQVGVDNEPKWARCPHLHAMYRPPSGFPVDNELQKPSAKGICLQHDCTLQRLERLFLRSEVFLLRNVAFSLRDAKVCPVFSASCPEPGLAGNKKDDSVPGEAEERGSGSKMHVFVPGWKFRCKVTLRLTCPPLSDSKCVLPLTTICRGTAPPCRDADVSVFS